MKLRTAIVVMVGLGLSVLTAACGDSDNEPAKQSFDQSSLGKQQRLADLLPEQIRRAGVISAATSATYPPMEYYDEDNKTIIGADVDLLNAMAKVWGVKVKLADVPFDQLLVGMSAGRYDIGMTPTIVKEERIEVLDLVRYLQTGSAVLVSSGNPDELGPDSLCGRRVAVEKGSAQELDDVPALSKACVDNGDKAIEIITFPALNQMALGLQSGRVDAVFTSDLALNHLAKQSNGQYEVAGDPINLSYRALQLPKNSPLAEAVVETLKYLKKDGAYDRILSNWGIGGAGVADFKVETAVETPSGA